MKKETGRFAKYIDRTKWKRFCYNYAHHLCKNKNGSCECPCHLGIKGSGKK